MFEFLWVNQLAFVVAYAVGEPASGLGTGTITDAQWVNLIVAVLLPILVALVTKSSAPPRVRSALLLFLSAVSGVLNEWLVANGPFAWDQAIFSAATIFVIGIATLYGLWKPTGVSDKATNTLVK